ncbi:hypothetical protein AKJ16_DCAP02252 [Drosera capensis]
MRSIEFSLSSSPLLRFHAYIKIRLESRDEFQFVYESVTPKGCRGCHMNSHKRSEAFKSTNQSAGFRFLVISSSSMVDNDQTVCCMCGDVGFPDKLFHCTSCKWRFQHSYCSNYYGESSDRFTDVCDWCQSEERRRTTLKQGGGSFKKGMVTSSSPRSAEKIKQQHRDKGEDSGSGGGSSGEKAGRNSGGSSSGVPSPRTGARRVFRLGLRWTKRVHEMDNHS